MWKIFKPVLFFFYKDDNNATTIMISEEQNVSRVRKEYGLRPAKLSAITRCTCNINVKKTHQNKQLVISHCPFPELTVEVIKSTFAQCLMDKTEQYTHSKINRCHHHGGDKQHEFNNDFDIRSCTREILFLAAHYIQHKRYVYLS